MADSQPYQSAGARKGFRVLAGVLATFVVLVGFPSVVMMLIYGDWHEWVMAANIIWLGIGLTGVARTGHWSRLRDRKETGNA